MNALYLVLALAVVALSGKRGAPAATPEKKRQQAVDAAVKQYQRRK